MELIKRGDLNILLDEFLINSGQIDPAKYLGMRPDGPLSAC
jgi:hypothetical protein